MRQLLGPRIASTIEVAMRPSRELVVRRTGPSSLLDMAVGAGRLMWRSAFSSSTARHDSFPRDAEGGDCA
jgi:hypothetical protein